MEAYNIAIGRLEKPDLEPSDLVTAFIDSLPVNLDAEVKINLKRKWIDDLNVTSQSTS